MTGQELAESVLHTLAEIAPEVDVTRVDRDADLRDELDLDSMDILRFATALHDKLGVDIPEADYPKIVRINTCVSYLLQQI